MGFAHHQTLFIISSFFLLSLSFFSRADLVDDICSKTPKPDTCTRVLRSDPRSNTSDLVALAFVSADVAPSQAKSGQDTIRSLIGVSDENPKLDELKDVLSSCLNDYGEALNKTNEFARFLKFRDYDSLGSYATVAKNDAVVCDGRFSKAFVVEPSQIKDASENLQAICSAVLVVKDELK